MERNLEFEELINENMALRKRMDELEARFKNLEEQVEVERELADDNFYDLHQKVSRKKNMTAMVISTFVALVLAIAIGVFSHMNDRIPEIIILMVFMSIDMAMVLVFTFVEFAYSIKDIKKMIKDRKEKKSK